MKKHCIPCRCRDASKCFRYRHVLSSSWIMPHNAMALDALLRTLRDYHPGRIICIFGCGGNRAAERRFQMGEVAGRLADLVVVTTDNPREEDPEKIADEICLGLGAAKGKYGRIPIGSRQSPMAFPCKTRRYRGDCRKGS
ncbi:MAG: glutamate ligase domain-containing protein [Eubacterium ramulus]